MISTPYNYFLNKPNILANSHGWIPHIPFAFYLVECMKPAVIVDLGTYSGNPYFAFCQAVRDLQLQSRCVVVDTWQGDMHVGNYGQEVYDRVKKINEHNFHAWFPKIMRGGVILLHDTRVRRKGFGVWKFLKEIKTQQPLLSSSKRNDHYP